MYKYFPFFYNAAFAALCTTRPPKNMRPALLINLSEIMLAGFVLCRDAVLLKLESVRGRFDVDAFVHFFDVLLPLVVLGQSATVRHDYGEVPGERYQQYLRRICIIFTATRRPNYKYSTLTKMAWFWFGILGVLLLFAVFLFYFIHTAPVSCSHLQKTYPRMYTWITENIRITDESWGEGVLNAYLGHIINHHGSVSDTIRRAKAAFASLEFHPEAEAFRPPPTTQRGANYNIRHIEASIDRTADLVMRYVDGLLGASAGNAQLPVAAAQRNGDVQWVAPALTGSDVRAEGGALIARHTHLCFAYSQVRILQHKVGSLAWALGQPPSQAPTCAQPGCATPGSPVRVLDCGDRSCAACGSCRRCSIKITALLSVNAAAMRDHGFVVHTDNPVEEAAEDAPVDDDDTADAAMDNLANAPGLGERPALGVRLELCGNFRFINYLFLVFLTPLVSMKVASSAGGRYGGTLPCYG
jgi:hypothetical protein